MEDKKQTKKKKPRKQSTLHASTQSVESYLWRGYGKSLGEVLDSQFVRLIKVNRATQTQWNWRKMAERWGNAKILEARDNTGPRAKKEHEGSESDDHVQDSHLDDKLRNVHDSEHASDVEGHSGGTEHEESGEKSKGKHGRRTSKTHKRTAKPKVLSSNDIRACRVNDKCEDTADLVFDPYDTRMRYTRLISNVKPMYIPEAIREDLDMDDIWHKEATYATQAQYHVSSTTVDTLPRGETKSEDEDTKPETPNKSPSKTQQN